MKSTFLTLFITVIAFQLSAQYYYKDILVPVQTAQQFQNQKARKVKTVKLSSYEYTNEPTEGFEAEQTFENNYAGVRTYTKSPASGESLLKTNFTPDGKLLSTVDTTDGASSTNTYQYDQDNRLTRITNISISNGQSKEKEEHFWYYAADGKPERMIKVKNDRDTTYIEFGRDEKGNIGEERVVRKRTALGTTYYYYNDNNQLTDIVRYNQKAGRLLPDFMFEYDDKNRVSTMLVVPEGSNEYMKWRYTYDDKGLKTKETCFNRRNQLLGRIEYKYEF